MLRSIKDLLGSHVCATDGKNGKTKDILFGDRNWRVRYLDVEMRRGLHLNLRYLSDTSGDGSESTRRLIETSKLEPPRFGPERREIPTCLSSDEISQCEGFAAHLPAEEMYDMEFRRFYRHAIYDERPFFGSLGMQGYIPPVTAYDHNEEEIRAHLERMGKIAGEHLHSAKGVMGYHVVGTDETLGIVSDLILDTEIWRIAYYVLDTRHGIPSRKYLVKTDSIERLDWSSSSLETNLSVAKILSMRRYWVYDSVNKEEGEIAYDYSGRPCFTNLVDEYF